VLKNLTEHSSWRYALRKVSPTKERATRAGEVAEAEAGLPDKALGTLRLIRDDENRDIAIYDIARAQSKFGKITEALQLARSAKYEAPRPYTIAFITASKAEWEAKAGKITEALQSADSIDRKFASLRVLPLVAVAAAQVRGGRSSEAAATVATALQIAREEGKSLGAEIPGALARAGFFTEALELARSIGHENLRAFAICSVAIAHAEVGKFGEASELVRSVRSSQVSAGALTKIAALQDKAGLKAEAASSLRDAMAVSLSSEDALRPVVLAWIAEGLRS
jgi:hypothetical protein